MCGRSLDRLSGFHALDGLEVERTAERRVILHCQKLLAQDTLPGVERQRLLRLAAAAENAIQRLAGWPAIEAA